MNSKATSTCNGSVDVHMSDVSRAAESHSSAHSASFTDGSSSSSSNSSRVVPFSAAATQQQQSTSTHIRTRAQLVASTSSSSTEAAEEKEAEHPPAKRMRTTAATGAAASAVSLATAATLFFDALRLIYTYLPFNDICAASFTCKHWYAALCGAPSLSIELTVCPHSSVTASFVLSRLQAMVRSPLGHHLTSLHLRRPQIPLQQLTTKDGITVEHLAVLRSFTHLRQLECTIVLAIDRTDEWSIEACTCAFPARLTRLRLEFIVSKCMWSAYDYRAIHATAYRDVCTAIAPRIRRILEYGVSASASTMERLKVSLMPEWRIVGQGEAADEHRNRCTHLLPSSQLHSHHACNDSQCCRSMDGR